VILQATTSVLEKGALSLPPSLQCTRHQWPGTGTARSRTHAYAEIAYAEIAYAEIAYAEIASNASRILKEQIVWKRPVPLSEPGASPFLTICSVSSP